MKNHRLLIVFILLILAKNACAETVYLKDGRVVKGKVISQSAAGLNLQEGGMVNKYYLEEIDRIEKEAEVPAAGEIDNFAPIDLQDISDISLEKQGLILRLFQLNGTHETLQKNLDSFFTQIPSDKAQELQKMFDIDDVMKQLMPVYAKYYTEEDLKGLIAFYESPAGQKMIQVTPELIKETIHTTAQYFKSKISP